MVFEWAELFRKGMIGGKARRKTAGSSGKRRPRKPSDPLPWQISACLRLDGFPRLQAEDPHPASLCGQPLCEGSCIKANGVAGVERSAGCGYSASHPRARARCSENNERPRPRREAMFRDVDVAPTDRKQPCPESHDLRYLRDRGNDQV